MQINIKDVPRQLTLAYLAGINVWMWAEPGMGKTHVGDAWVRVMKRNDPDFEDHYLYVPTLGPTDIQAAMPDVAGKKKLLEFFNNAKLPNRYTNPDAKGTLRLGELANGDPTVVKLLQPYVNNEDMSGVLQKPEGITVIADSNRLVDKAGSIQQMRAFLSRFMHWDVFSEPAGDIAYGERQNWHPIVLTFMKEHPDLINNYEAVFIRAGGTSAEESKRTEEGKRGIWSSKRGLERLSALEYAVDTHGIPPHSAMVYGTLGTQAGAHYLAVRNMVTSLAKLEEIIADPKAAAVPTSPGGMYAQVLMLASCVEADDTDKAVTYTQRLPEDMQILALQKMTKRISAGGLKRTKAFLKWAADRNMTELLGGEA